jgi:hypothetical protein
VCVCVFAKLFFAVKTSSLLNERLLILERQCMLALDVG